MDRREFLYRSASFLAGSLWGIGSFSNAVAFGGPRNNGYSSQPRIALIIDDIGQSLSAARQFIDLGAPITFSILPQLAHSYELAMDIHDKGQEVMLHQPMEPHNSGLDPGPGALYVGYATEMIFGIMEENVSKVPFALGINNHMGSKFTECEKEMDEVLHVVRKRGLFFIDSLTSSRSMGYHSAKRLHMSTGHRDIFLDDFVNEPDIFCQLNKLEEHAQRYGHAIGIGHPFPETARAIRQFIREGKDRSFSLVHVSSLLYV